MCKHRVNINARLAKEIKEQSPIKFGKLVARGIHHAGMRCVKCGASYGYNGWGVPRGRR